jgi:hypothetical protein
VFTRMMRFVSHTRDEQSGVALAAVIGVMAVALLVMTLVTTSIVSGVGHTSATRAGVQSQAAAEAGIAAAREVVDGNKCTTATIAGTTPKYSVAISWSAVAPPATPTTWTSSCPPTSAAQIRYVSTGTAASGGVAGQTAQNTSSIESIYGGKSVTNTDTGTNAAIYSWGSTVSGASGISGGVGLLNTLAVGGPKATIQVKNGNAACSGLNLNASADWVIQNGSFADNGLCATINGSIWASGSVSVTGLLGLGLASISGSVTAGSLTMSGLSNIGGGAWIKGSASLTPLLSSVTGGSTSPSLKSNQSGPSPYGNPTVPNWYDYSFPVNSGPTSPQWPGFTVVTLGGSTTPPCSAAGINAALGNLSAGPIVVNAQNCTNGNLLSGVTLGALQNDVALILSSSVNVDVGGLSLQLGSHKIWIIQTDNKPDGMPTCPGGSLTRSGINLVFPNMMIYTPCTYTETGLLGVNTYTGQIYAGQVNLGGLARIMNYEPIGLPGVDLSTGTSTATGGRSLISTRNVQSGG